MFQAQRPRPLRASFWTVVFPIIAVAAFTIPAIAQAATITVNSTEDNATSGDTLCTFREAMQNANTDTDSSAGDCTAGVGIDEIEFEVAGTYLFNTAEVQITDSTKINTQGKLAVTLQANTTNLSGIRGFNITNGADVEFESVNLVGGRGNAEGHRIFDAGTVLFRDSSISGITSRYGTAIRVAATSTGDSSGGAETQASSLVLERSDVHSNSVRNGGAINFSAPGNLTITQSTIRNNSTTFNGGGPNGGIFVYGESGVVTIESSTLSGNVDRNGDGSGSLRYQPRTGSLDITNSTISGNGAVLNGGGIYLDSTQPVSISHSTITNNASDAGNGSSGQRGDGNGTGGGVYIAPTHSGAVTVRASIIAGNRVGTGTAPDDVQTNGFAITTENSLIDYLDGTDNPAFSFAELALGSLGPNGGPTQTHGIPSSSVAVDAGGTVDYSRDALDQRGIGFDRSVGSAIDAGALERPDPSLVHHWPFDDEAGDSVMDVVGMNNGVLSGSGAFLADGVVGGGLRLFRSGSMQINAQDINSIWTLAFWARRGTASNSSVLLSSDAGQILLETEKSRRNIGASIPGVGAVEFSYSAPLNQDMHFIMINRGNRTELYANGVLADTIDRGFTLPLNSLGNATSSFAGRIDDLRVYNGDLSAEQAGELYNALKPEEVATGLSCNVTAPAGGIGDASVQALQLNLASQELDINIGVGDAVAITASVQTDNGTLNNLNVELIDDLTGYVYCANGVAFDLTRVFIEPGEYPIRLRVTPASGSAVELIRTVTVAANGTVLIDGLKGEHFQFNTSREPYPDFSTLVAATSPPKVPVSTKEASFIHDENTPLYSRVYYKLESNGTFWDGLSQNQYYPDLAQHKNHAVRWTGKLRINKFGVHEFMLVNNDRVRVYINDVLLIDHSTNGSGDFDFASSSAMRELAAGTHDLRVELYDPADDNVKTTELSLLFRQPGDTEFQVIPSDHYYHAVMFPDDDLKAMRDKAATSATVLALESYETERLHPGNESQVRRARIDALRTQFSTTPFGSVAGLLVPQANAGAAGANFGYPLPRWENYMRATNSPVSWDWFHAILNDMASYKGGFGPGMRPDGLWFQHAARGLQIHHDGYGIDGTARMFPGTLSNTRWAQTDTQLTAKADFAITADWFHYKGHTDRRVSGRWNFGISGYPARVAGIANRILTMATLDEQTRQALETSRDRLQRKDSVEDLSGTRFFPSGLLGVHRTQDWYIATKLVNQQVAGPETFAWAYNKNVQYGIGHTEILRSGEDFSGNFKTVQNHSSLPGITHEYVEDLAYNNYQGYRGRNNTFAAGVSDGRIGTTAFEMNLQDKWWSSPVTARKSYFNTEDGMVAMGTGINVKSELAEPVYTTINQVRWLSNIVYDLGDATGQQTIELGAGDANRDIVAANTAWFHHDGIGYIVVPGATPVDLRLFAEQRTFNMAGITSLSKNTDEVSENVFQLSINHGINPVDGGYVYYVLPGIAVADMPAYIQDLPINVLSNTSALQSVRDERNGSLYTVFHSAGELRSAQNALLLSADKPSVALLKDVGNNRMLYVADGEQYANSDTIQFGVGKPDGEVVTLEMTPPVGFFDNRRGEQVEFIVDITPQVSISVSDGIASENPIDAGQFTISLTSANVSGSPLTIPLSLSGTALNGRHFADIATSIEIPPGESSAVLDIEPLDDTTTYGNSTLAIAIDTDNLPEGVHAGNTLSAMLDIADDDRGPVQDSDADGIPDVIEQTLAGANDDIDGDGIANYLDADSDNDGIADGDEFGLTGTDTDADGIDDLFDVDATSGTDADGDGIDDNFKPSDNDGDNTPDYLDSDIDGDGLSNAEEGQGDADADGLADFRDLDTDNDSIPDQLETLADPDGDGVPNTRDLDSDNDGITDLAENGGDDANGTGRISNVVDTIPNGFDDAFEIIQVTLLDDDHDKTPNFVDLDSDNDGVADLVSASGESADSNNDGRVDAFSDENNDGLDDAIALAPLLITDADADGTPDYRDRDADNDGVPDPGLSNVLDANGDGVIDTMADMDEDGLPDDIDVDLTGGEDADNDGIDDSADADFVAEQDADGDGIIDSRDADANGDGIVDDLSTPDVTTPPDQPSEPTAGTGTTTTTPTDPDSGISTGTSIGQPVVMPGQPTDSTDKPATGSPDAVQSTPELQAARPASSTSCNNSITCGKLDYVSLLVLLLCIGVALVRHTIARRSGLHQQR